MSIFIGLNVGNYLSDVDNQPEALRNLGLNRLDLNHIRGVQAAGMTKKSLHNFSGLNVDQEKVNFSNYMSALVVAGELNNLGDISVSADYNVRIDDQLRAGAIKYNYLDYSSGVTKKSADISTSRVSSWSQILDGPVVNGQPTYGPIFYGADTLVSGDANNNNESVIDLENIVFTGELTQKRFPAEIPTHRVNIKINGQTRSMFTMRNIPFRFEGVFNSANIQLEVSNIGLVQPTILFTKTTLPEGSLGRELAITSPAGATQNTYNYSASGAIADHFIDIYYNPNSVTTLDFYAGKQDTGSGANKTLRIREFPNVEMKKINHIDLQYNIFSEMPNFFKISAGEVSGHNNTLRFINMSANNLFESDLSGNQQLNDYVPSTVTTLGLNCTFSDETPIDIRQLKVGGGSGGAVEPSALTAFYFDAYSGRNSTTRRMLGTTTSANDVSPKVNGNTIRSYNCRRHQFKYLPHDVTHNSFDGSGNFETTSVPNELESLDLYGNWMLGQLDLNGNVVPISVPDTISSIYVGSNNLETINVSGKTNLKSYHHFYNRGYANPPAGTNGGTINGYFSGCDSLEKLSFYDSYVVGDIGSLFTGLPSLLHANFNNTRLNGRFNSGSFAGTTNITEFYAKDCNFDSSAGALNFWGNNFEQVQAEAPPGGLGAAYGGGYYGGTMIDSAQNSYYLIVSPKSAENFIARYTGTGSGTQGLAQPGDGALNTQQEYQGDSEYAAAAYADQLSIQGTDGITYNDWYIPARDELEMLYRNFKPTNDVNDTTSPAANGNSVPSFNGLYGTTVPGKTNKSLFQGGTGSQAFESDRSNDGNPGIFATQLLSNSNFNNSTLDFTVVSNLAGATVQSSQVILGNKLVVSTGSKGRVELNKYFLNNSPRTPVPRGTYDVEVNFDEVKKTEIPAGQFDPNVEYEILNLGSIPAFNNLNYSAFNQSTNTITIGAGHGLENGTIVKFNQDDITKDGFTNLADDSDYKVMSSNSAAGTIQLQQTTGGPAINLAQSAAITVSLAITGASVGTYTFTGGVADRATNDVGTTNVDVTLYEGDTLTISNSESAAHPLQYENNDGSVFLTESGGSISYLFSTAGTYRYRCQNHSNMVGTITVLARNGTFDITTNRIANWNAAGANGVSVGSIFTATAEGIGIYGGTANPRYGSTSDLDKVFVIAEEQYTGQVPNGPDMLEIEQGLTSVTSVQSGRFAVADHPQPGLVIKFIIKSNNCDFKLNSVSVRNQTGVYWTSTEGSSTITGIATGIAQSFVNGEQLEATKTSMYNVRPVRKIAVAAANATERQGTSDVFKPCGGSLKNFELEGKGKTAPASTPNIRGTFPNVNWLSAIRTFKVVKTELTGTLPIFNGSNALSQLYLNDNNLSGAFSIQNDSVQDINCSNNEFTSASVIIIPNAWNLNLSNNNITNTFPDLSESRLLSNINFSNNDLKDYQIGSISKLLQLNSLNLANNDINFAGFKRLLEDLKENYEAANRPGVSVSVESNPKVTPARLSADLQATDTFDFLRSKGWSISLS
jgi:plastocyanin